MKIALSYRVDYYPQSDVELSAKQLGRLETIPVESYARCVDRAFVELGHETANVYGFDTVWNPSDYDLYLELDNGRDGNGQLGFGKQFIRSDIQMLLPKAVWFVDSHGQPDLHKSLASMYDHVFFAVWDRRDLFKDHKSAHWCPNATDTAYFCPNPLPTREPEFDFGFFGSKTGIDRADKMIEICNKHGWSYDVRQIGGGPGKHKWPRTSVAMNNCKTLFNHGQKHDAPNLRIMESMAVKRPLISDLEPRSGMSKLFEAGTHYLDYESYTQTGLEQRMLYAMSHPGWCMTVADIAYKLVLEKHLIKHRVQQMLEVFNAA